MTAKEFIQKKTGYVPNSLLSQEVVTDLMERYAEYKLKENKQCE